jgi:uncharacterized membrane protein
MWNTGPLTKEICGGASMLDWIPWGPVNPALVFLAIVIVVEGILVVRFVKKGKLWKFVIAMVATIAAFFLIAVLVHVLGLME